MKWPENYRTSGENKEKLKTGEKQWRGDADNGNEQAKINIRGWREGENQKNQAMAKTSLSTHGTWLFGGYGWYSIPAWRKNQAGRRVSALWYRRCLRWYAGGDIAAISTSSTTSYQHRAPASAWRTLPQNDLDAIKLITLSQPRITHRAPPVNHRSLTNKRRCSTSTRHSTAAYKNNGRLQRKRVRRLLATAARGDGM